MELRLPDPLQQDEDGHLTAPPSSIGSPGSLSSHGLTSMIDSVVLRDEDLDELLNDEHITWDFLLSRPSTPSSAPSLAASEPCLTPGSVLPARLWKSRRDSLTSSVPSELQCEGVEADSSFMTSVGPVSSVSLLPSSVESLPGCQEGLLIGLEEEMSSLIVPELPSPTASTTTENLLGDIDEPSFVLFKSPIPTWKRRLRLVPWRLVLFLFTLLILIRPLDKKSAFRSSTAFEPSYFEVAIQRLDLSADLEAERVLKRKVDMPAVAETMQVDYSTVIIALLVVIIGMMIVRRSESKIETRAKRVAPRNAAPAVRASPKRAATPTPASAAPAARFRHSLSAEETQVVNEEASVAVNVCLFGSPGVGVSSLIARQVWNEDAEDCDFSSAVGHRQSYKRKGAPTVYLTLCDWSDERTRTQIGRAGLHVAVVVFGLDDQASFAEAQQKVKQIRGAASETGSLRAIHLVANKSDLLSSAGPAKGVRLTATRKRATDWAQKEGLPMHEVNALEKKSVEGLFRSVAREVRESACGKKRS